MKKSYSVIALSVFLITGIFLSNSPALAAVGDCGNNFTGNLIYSGQRSGPGLPFTTVIPANYEFKTDLSLVAVGEDELQAGENVEIVLVMDRSDSMNEEIDGTKKIESAKDALKAVVNTFVTAGDLDNRLSLVTYNASVTLDQTLTSNYQKVIDAVDSFTASGQTNIGGALLSAANHIKSSADADAKRIIIIATDGKQTVGLPVNFGMMTVPGDTTVFSIGIGSDADEATLKTIAEQSGDKAGRYYYSDASDLEDTFKEIIEDVLIPFRPENVRATFYRDNADKFNLLSANPVFSNVSNSEVEWSGLGVMNNGDSNNFEMIYKQAGILGSGLPINTGSILVEYDLFGSACSEIVLVDLVTIENNVPECTGVTPANASLCAGDDLSLSVDVPRQLASSCTSAIKCEYTCDTGLELIGGVCVMKGQCGSAEKNIWCRKEPTTGWCSGSSSLVEGPTPNDNRWTWVCAGMFGGPSEHCSALRACGEGWKEVGM